MIIFKNKRGKGNIHIADVGRNKVRLITQEKVIKTFERDKFDAPVEGDAHDFLSSGDVTREQADLYWQKMSSMEADAKEKEKRKANREREEAWEKMTWVQRFEKFLKEAPPSKNKWEGNIRTGGKAI